MGLGCANTQSITRPTIVGVRDVAGSGGIPEIVRVVDLGGMRLPKRGDFAIKTGDNKGAIGELLLLWGKDFGKQPAVSIGGEPTDVLAHVKGGGVVVRVPWGIASGSMPVTVTTPRGSATRRFAVRRVGLLAAGAELRVFELGGPGEVKLGGKLALAGVEALEVCSDGSAAYAVTSDKKLTLHTIDLAAPTPRVVTQDALPGTKIAGIARANRAAVLAVVTDTHLVYVDTHVGTIPALYKAHPLPRTIAGRPLGGVALSPDGRTLAFIAKDKNELFVFDASVPGNLPAPLVKDVAPEARLPLLHHVAFSLGGTQLWVVTGDTAGSIAAGHQTSEVISFELLEGRLKGEPKRWSLDADLAPLSATMARSAPTPAGSAIRTQTASSALYVTAYPHALVAKAGASEGGVVLRSVPDKPVGKLVGGKHLLLAVRVAGRPQQVVAVGRRTAGGKAEYFLLGLAAWDAQAKPTIVPLGPASQLVAPVPGAQLAIQP